PKHDAISNPSRDIAATNLYRLIFFFGKNTQLLGHFSRELPNVHDVDGQSCLVRVCPRKHEETVNQQCEPVDFFEHAADDFPVSRLITMASQSGLAHAANRSEWSAQLMRCVCSESAHLIKRRLQARQRFVKNGSEAAQFVVGIIDGQTIVQTFCIDRSCTLGHAVHRSKRATSEDVSA